MEEYKRRLQKENVWYKVIFVIFAILTVLSWFTDWAWRGGVSGGFVAACLNCIIAIKKNKELLKDEKKLCQSCIEAKDERLEQIRLVSARMTLGILLVGLSIAIVISMYFNMIIFWTLGGVLVFACVILLIVHAIYKRLM